MNEITKHVQLLPGYDISLEGIISKDGVACTHLVKDGKVNIVISSKTYTVCINWLRLIAWYEIDTIIFGEFTPDMISFVPASSQVIKTVCKEVAVFNVPVYYKGTYRVIPGFSRYAVNNSGRVIDISTGNKVTNRHEEAQRQR